MNEESQEQDIVEELNDWAFITDEVQGKAMMVMLSGEVFRDAAQEIQTLRTAGDALVRVIKSDPRLLLLDSFDSALRAWEKANEG